MAKILMADDDREFLEAGKAVLKSEGMKFFRPVMSWPRKK
jgi:hypothetical protein